MSSALLLTLQLGPALLGGLVALGLDAFDRRSAAVAVAATGCCSPALSGSGPAPTSPGSLAFGVLLVGRAFSTVPGLIMVLAAVALWGGWNEFAGRPGGGSSAALVAFAAVASAAVAQSFDLLILLVALETAAAAGYALVADAKTSRSDESALKYFVQGAIATGLLVMGLAVLVGGFVPSGAYGELAVVFAKPAMPTAALAGALLILAALAFKSSPGAVPLMGPGRVRVRSARGRPPSSRPGRSSGPWGPWRSSWWSSLRARSKTGSSSCCP